MRHHLCPKPNHFNIYTKSPEGILKSMLIAEIEELFPKDKKIFLMCGGGGYANMMKEVHIHMGYDKDYNYD